MSIQYCVECNKNVDTDVDLHEEHFEEDENGK